MSKTLLTYQRGHFDPWGWVQGFGWELSLVFEPRDLWVGLYWTWETETMLNLYVCLLPMLPIRLTLWGLR